MSALNPRSTILVLAALGSVSVLAAAQAPTAAPSRGELLYSTHCVSCHTAQIHWRDKRLATDWTSLKGQVRRWQSNVGLNWNDDEIVDVARRLNTLYYHFPQTSDQVGLNTRR
jgi:mono/diheme cytochrome c family protein